MTLTFVEPGEIPDTYNIMLYGPSGSGKSTAAASAPGPILYLNADGPDALRFPRRQHGSTKIREVTVTGADVLTDVLLLLRHIQGHDGEGPQTVVLDTLSSVYTTILEDKAKGGRPTLPQYGDTGTAIERFCREVRDMPVNLVVLAEQFSVKDESTGIVERVPYSGTSNPALGEKIVEMMSVVGYCGRVAPAGEKGKPRYVATLVDAPGRRGKDRTDALGTHRDLDLTEWIETAKELPAPVEEAVAA